VFEHLHQSLFRAVPGAVILIHHDEVGVVRGFFFGIGAVRDVVVGESDEARGIELVDQCFDLFEVGAALVGAHVAFVADAPGKNAGVIGGLLDHFLKHLLGESDYFWVRELRSGKLPDGDFGREQDAVLISVFEDFFMLRIVHWTRERCVEKF